MIKYYSTFSQNQKDLLVWVGSDNLAVENNDNGQTPSGYPDITQQNLLSSEGINIFQYVSIENSESIQQTVNITKIGVYDLYFHYVERPTYSFNNLQIYFNNVLLDIVKTSQSSWTEYSYSFPITQTGIYVLMFQGQPEQPDNTSAFIGIRNIPII